MPEPIVIVPASDGARTLPVSADGTSFIIKEWRGSGPATLHVHHQDDEAWHVLEGTLLFRFSDRELEAPAGSTVFVPAGVPHAYQSRDARYLIIMTPRVAALIAELQTNRDSASQAAIYARHASTLLE
jgi:mannose-6-phosphate isomerase-like protein (cupin superfamily)